MIEDYRSFFKSTGIYEDISTGKITRLFKHDSNFDGFLKKSAAKLSRRNAKEEIRKYESNPTTDEDEIGTLVSSRDNKHIKEFDLLWYD